MSDSVLFTILLQLYYANRSDVPAILSAASTHLLSLSPSDACLQLTYPSPSSGERVLMLLPEFAGCPEFAPFLSLVIKRGRECCNMTNQLDLRDSRGWTPLHYFAFFCSDLSLIKVVLRERPPSLFVRVLVAGTPLQASESRYASLGNLEQSAFFRAVTADFNASNFVAIERACGGSSPYLDREICRQATALRVAVVLCLNRQEEAPSAPSSVKAGVAISLLCLLRDFGRVRNSSDLLRRVLEYVGPYASSCDAD